MRANSISNGLYQNKPFGKFVLKLRQRNSAAYSPLLRCNKL
jgi:hypothetical protein